MTPLRQRMLDALVLRGLATRTREAYIEAIAGLVRHYRPGPDTLTAHVVQRYLLHQLQDKKLSRSSVISQCACACRFLYGTVLVWMTRPLRFRWRRRPSDRRRSSRAMNWRDCSPWPGI